MQLTKNGVHTQSTTYNETTIMHLRGERMNVIDSFVSVTVFCDLLTRAIILQAKSLLHHHGPQSCFHAGKLRSAVRELISMAEIMPYTRHNSGNASLRWYTSLHRICNAPVKVDPWVSFFFRNVHHTAPSNHYLLQCSQCSFVICIPFIVVLFDIDEIYCRPLQNR